MINYNIQFFGGRGAGFGGGKSKATATNGSGVKQWSDEKVENYWNEGLNPRRTTNKYVTMDRVNDDETKIVVRVADDHLLSTKYGYALVLDDKHVVFLKENQVSRNYYANEVILNKGYFNVKEWGDFSDRFGSEPKNLKWNEWLSTAKKQRKTQVKWESHYHSAKARGIMRNIAKRNG